jgi:hypothetical protein
MEKIKKFSLSIINAPKQMYLINFNLFRYLIPNKKVKKFYLNEQSMNNHTSYIFYGIENINLNNSINFLFDTDKLR